MVEIVRSSKGRPSNLSDRERRELRALLGKVEPGELAKKVATSSASPAESGAQIDDEPPRSPGAVAGCRIWHGKSP